MLYQAHASAIVDVGAQIGKGSRGVAFLLIYVARQK